ncbi:MAG: EamA family transporter [Bacteroidota bacterium]
MLSVFYGLLSAIGWGAADFTGGLASRKSAPYQVLFLAELAGLVPLFIAALVMREPLPALRTWAWGAAASAVGTVGLLLLYRALAGGHMTIAAPVSALLAAVVPVVVGALTQGLPAPLTLLGFFLALASIWIISQNGERSDRHLTLHNLQLPFIAGLFFGFYFVMIHQATREAFFWPLVSARLAGTLIMAGYALARRGPVMPKPEVWPVAILGGVLDVSGNFFYVLASQTGRLDVAAVLGSLYPASTVLLAWIVLKERISRLQAGGIALALAAITLLTL